MRQDEGYAELFFGLNEEFHREFVRELGRREEESAELAASAFFVLLSRQRLGLGGNEDLGGVGALGPSIVLEEEMQVGRDGVVLQAESFEGQEVPISHVISSISHCPTCFKKSPTTWENARCVVICKK
jgi:hypothetical protein